MAGKLVAALAKAKTGLDDAAQAAANQLDVSTAARMQRAAEQGFNTRLYHGTHATDVDGLIPGDVGVHLGTSSQANNRLLDVAKQRKQSAWRGREFDEGANVIPVRAKLGNSLLMDDVGMWNDPYAVSVGLMSTPVGRKNRARLLDMQDEMNEIMESYAFGDDTWVGSPESSEYLDEIRSMISESGYDSIRYSNQVENTYNNLTELRPEIKAQVESLAEQARQIEKNAASRAPSLDDYVRGLTDEKDLESAIENWSRAAQADFKTAEETTLLNSLYDKIDALKKDGYEDPHSYVVLNPESIRSVNAAFDPKNIGKNDLLGAATIGGMATAGAVGAGLMGAQNVYGDSERVRQVYEDFKNRRGSKAQFWDNLRKFGTYGETADLALNIGSAMIGPIAEAVYTLNDYVTGVPAEEMAARREQRRNQIDYEPRTEAAQKASDAPFQGIGLGIVGLNELTKPVQPFFKAGWEALGPRGQMIAAPLPSAWESLSPREKMAIEAATDLIP